MKLYLASGNSHKKQEIAALFPDYTIVLPRDEGLDFAPEETGTTFLENSMLKAGELWKLVHAPVLADDSGICVDILGGRPGIYSARYTGGLAFLPEQEQKLTDSGRNRLLLAEAEKAAEAYKETGTPPKTCRFVCAFVLYLSPYRFFAAQETLEGILAAEEAGSGGFGYDPIVFLPEQGKTVAQLTETEKNALSHRAKAAAAIRKMMKDMSRGTTG
jgi:XTP/dITP diphosphohydrolase